MNTGEIDENFGKIMRKMWVQFAKTGDPPLPADISSDGKAYEWPLYDLENEQVMVFDENNIHTEKETDIKLLDRERTYFLTKYLYFLIFRLWLFVIDIRDSMCRAICRAICEYNTQL